MTPPAESDVARLVLVVGPEEVLAERAIEQIIREARSADPAVEIIELDGPTLEVGRFLELAGPTLFGAPRLVLITGVPPTGADADLFVAGHDLRNENAELRIRLQEARSLLVARAGEVARVGHLVGYDGPTQFNREYRRLFGAPPGQDAARLRADAEPHDVRSLP